MRHLTSVLEAPRGLKRLSGVEVRGTVYYKCLKHGLRPKEVCELCNLKCEGCGEYKEFPNCSMGDYKFEVEDPHKYCDQKTDGFFLKKSPDSLS